MFIQTNLSNYYSVPMVLGPFPRFTLQINNRNDRNALGCNIPLQFRLKSKLKNIYFTGRKNMGEDS